MIEPVWRLSLESQLSSQYIHVFFSNYENHTCKLLMEQITMILLICKDGPSEIFILGAVRCVQLFFICFIAEFSFITYQELNELIKS